MEFFFLNKSMLCAFFLVFWHFFLCNSFSSIVQNTFHLARSNLFLQSKESKEFFVLCFLVSCSQNEVGTSHCGSFCCAPSDSTRYLLMHFGCTLQIFQDYLSQYKIVDEQNSGHPQRPVSCGALLNRHCHYTGAV